MRTTASPPRACAELSRQSDPSGWQGLAAGFAGRSVDSGLQPRRSSFLARQALDPRDLYG